MVRKIIQPWWIRKQIALTVARLPSWGLRCCRPREPLSEPRRGEFRRRAANRRANRTGNAACQEIVFESSWRHILRISFLNAYLLAPRTRSIPRFQLGQFRLKFHPFCKLFFFPVNCGIHLAYKSQNGYDYFPAHIFLKLTTKNRVSASPVIPHEKIYKRYSDEIVWKCANTV